jgi:hypothetical protein
MNKVQTFRRQLMRRNFHLISSLGDEILFSRAGTHEADSTISLTAPHRRQARADAYRKKFVRLR